MFARYIRFIDAVSVNRLGRVAVILATSSFITFLLLEAARFAGLLTNAYLGLITYLVFPAIFVVGLILIPIAWQKRKRDSGLTTSELLRDRVSENARRGGFFGSRVFMSIMAFTLINVLFMAVASSRMVHFMDSAEFCGTACHTVMNPEWTTYQVSPHARVKCVECHVGEGAGALIDSKINGMRQIISVTFDLLERPIPTPVHNLRPSRETCEHCHWPEKFYGRRLKTITRYADDETSTVAYSTLSLKVDAGKGEELAGIHWHVAEENEVRYASVADERKEMIWVDVRQEDGTFKRYRNRATRHKDNGSSIRTLDCVDCHNRATHIYESPGDAVDERMAQGLIDRNLPFIKRKAVAAITADYASEEAAMEGIPNSLRGYYKRVHPEVARTQIQEIDQAITTLQAVYSRNVHDEMNIEWDTYPSLIGHRAGVGCFRCHNPDLVGDDGEAISSDCTMCHSILAYDSPTPFAFVQPPDSSSADFRMHQYLLSEFVESSGK